MDYKSLVICSIIKNQMDIKAIPICNEILHDLFFGGYVYMFKSYYEDKKWKALCHQ